MMLKLRTIHRAIILLLLVLFVFSGNTFAQEGEKNYGFTTSNIDSEEPESVTKQRQHEINELKKRLKKAQGKEKLEIYYGLYNLYAEETRGREEWDNTIAWMKEADRQESPLHQERSRIARSFYCYNTPDYVLYDRIIAEDLDFFRRRNYWEDYDYLICLYLEKLIARGRLTQASEMAQNLLLDADDRNDVYAQGLAYQQLGRVEKELGYFDAAKKLLRKGLGLQMGSRDFDDNSLADTYHLLFDVLFTEGNYKELLIELSHMQVLVDYWRKNAKKNKTEQTVIDMRQMTVWSYMSRAYTKLGRMSEAKAYMDKLATLGFLDGGSHEKEILTARMDYHAAMGDWKPAIAWGIEIRNDYKIECDSLNAYNYGKMVADIYQQNGQYRDACEELKANISMQQLIRNKFSAAMVLSSKENIDDRIVINQQRDKHSILLLGGIFLIVLVIGNIFIIRLVYKQKRNKELLDEEMLNLLGMRTDEFFMTIRRRTSLRHRKKQDGALDLAGIPMEEKKKRYRRRYNIGPDRVNTKF